MFYPVTKHLNHEIELLKIRVQEQDELILEIQKQMEAMRMSLKNYAEKKQTPLLWGRKRL